MTKEVVLVPGLWNPRLAMAPLGRLLARRGYSVRVFAYRGRDSPRRAGGTNVRWSSVN